jgi:hypothetical protein
MHIPQHNNNNEPIVDCNNEIVPFMLFQHNKAFCW